MWILINCTAAFFGSYATGRERIDDSPHRNTVLLFVEWRHSDSVIVLGKFGADGKKRIAAFSCTLRDLKKADVEKWLGTGRRGALLLFHCMWGQQKGFHHKKYLQPIEAVLALQPQNGIHTEISFIWHAGSIAYRKNWNHAAGKGEPLGNILYWITEHYNHNVHVLCHSMGNRFFEGVLRTMPASQKAFRTITLFSADLDNSSSDIDFRNSINAAGELYIYIHHKDRFLLSSWFHGRPRLGRTGPMPPATETTVIDMTKHVKRIQNHTHLDKSWVQEQLAIGLRN